MSKAYELAAERDMLLVKLEERNELIRILWKYGEFSMSVGNSLSEDGVLRAALRGVKS